VRITFEGREWDFDLEAVTLKQGVAMHLAYGFNLDQWFEALGETDPRALQCLWWLMLQQDGKKGALADADCSLIELAAAFGDAEDEEGQEEEPEEPDPTPPSPPAVPPSPEPSTPTATTPKRPARKRAPAAIASTPGI
jgi:hypothetical protein